MPENRTPRAIQRRAAVMTPRSSATIFASQAWIELFEHVHPGTHHPSTGFCRRRDGLDLPIRRERAEVIDSHLVVKLERV